MSNIAIKGAATGSGTFTLEAPATSTNRTLVLPDEAGTVLTSASSIPAANLTGTVVQTNVPAFRAFRPGTQNPSRYTWTKVTLSSETFDTDSSFDSTTDYRFTPTIAGYYQFNAFGAATGSPPEAYVAVRQNNAGVITAWFNASGVSQWTGAISGLLYANGTTDYFELFVYTAAASPAFSSLSFSGILVRAA